MLVFAGRLGRLSVRPQFALFVGLLVLALAVGCSQADDSAAGRPLPGVVSSWRASLSECSERSSGDGCVILDETTGYRWIVVRGDNVNGRLVVVDPGGPFLDAEAVVSQVARLATDPTFREDTLVSLIPPEPEPLSARCLSSSPAERIEACGISRDSGDVYLVDYFVSLDLLRDVLERGGESVDVLGSSYAASRWAYPIATKADSVVPVDHAVFVSPLRLGTRVDEIWDAQIEAARVIWSRVLFDGCESSECLDTIPIGDLSWCGSCDPFSFVARSTGLDMETVTEGLIGLGSFADDNGKLLRDGIDVNGKSENAELVLQGAASFQGTDLFGSPHLSTVEFLKGVCPVLTATNSDVKSTGPLAGCSSSSWDWEQLAKGAEFPGVGAGRTCYVSMHPDPVLGNASARGGFGVGQSFGGHVVGRFGHGDLQLGLAPLQHLRATAVPGDSCGT